MDTPTFGMFVCHPSSPLGKNSGYDALSYPLFFPRGELGWHANIPKVGVSMDEVDAYRAMHRASNANDEDAG